MSENKRASFESLIGQKVAIASLILGNDLLHLHEVTVRGVESGGLWIERAELTQDILRKFKAQSAPRTVVFFLPYHQIHIAMSAIDLISLSESAFGLSEEGCACLKQCQKWSLEAPFSK